MRVLPSEQVCRSAINASRAERRARVVDVVAFSAVPAPADAIPSSVAPVPTTSDTCYRQLALSAARPAAGWLAHVLGQTTANEASAAGFAAAAYERVDSWGSQAIRPVLPGAAAVA